MGSGEQPHLDQMLVGRENQVTKALQDEIPEGAIVVYDHSNDLLLPLSYIDLGKVLGKAIQV